MSIKMNMARKLLKLRKDSILKKQKNAYFMSIYDVLEIKNSLREPALFKKFALRNLIAKTKKIANVDCVCFNPNYKNKYFKNTPHNPDILFVYVHGGGFVNGFAEQGAYFIKAISRRIGCTSLAINYSLSPEVTHPFALNQIFDVYLEIIKTHEPSKIILAGESAGGNLCMALMLKLKQANIQMPQVALISSPYLDLTNQGISYTTNEESDVSLSKSQTPYMSTAYIIGNQVKILDAQMLKHPLISPIFGNFAGFPPMFLSVCSDELLYSDTIAAFENCKRDGVKVKLHVTKECFHGYMIAGDMFEESKLVNNEAAKFVKQIMHLNQINLID